MSIEVKATKHLFIAFLFKVKGVCQFWQW